MDTQDNYRPEGTLYSGTRIEIIKRVVTYHVVARTVEEAQEKFTANRFAMVGTQKETLLDASEFTDIHLNETPSLGYEEQEENAK